MKMIVTTDQKLNPNKSKSLIYISSTLLVLSFVI